MNQLILVIVFVVYVYFGGKYVPNLLKQNKEILLGIVGGLVLCSFFGVQFEEFANAEDCNTAVVASKTTCGSENLPPPHSGDSFALCDYISWSGMHGWLRDNPRTQGHLQSGDPYLCSYLTRTAVAQKSQCARIPGSSSDERSSCATSEGGVAFDALSAAHMARERVRSAPAAGAPHSGRQATLSAGQSARGAQNAGH